MAKTTFLPTAPLYSNKNRLLFIRSMDALTEMQFLLSRASRMDPNSLGYLIRLQQANDAFKRHRRYVAMMPKLPALARRQAN